MCGGCREQILLNWLLHAWELGMSALWAHVAVTGHELLPSQEQLCVCAVLSSHAYEVTGPLLTVPTYSSSMRHTQTISACTEERCGSPQSFFPPQESLIRMLQWPPWPWQEVWN
uniref:Uncharacterized protein n=1 Tax=Ficedula albicollis TaxID=59894 RepID=A0A803VDG0_FICAL